MYIFVYNLVNLNIYLYIHIYTLYVFYEYIFIYTYVHDPDCHGPICAWALYAHTFWFPVGACAVQVLHVCCGCVPHDLLKPRHAGERRSPWERYGQTMLSLY